MHDYHLMLLPRLLREAGYVAMGLLYLGFIAMAFPEARIVARGDRIGRSPDSAFPPTRVSRAEDTGHLL